MVVILARCSVDILAEPAAAPWPVVAPGFSGVVVWLDLAAAGAPAAGACAFSPALGFILAPPLASDEPLTAGLLSTGLSMAPLSLAFGLSASDAFGAWPVVSFAFGATVFCAPGFMAGATFSAGAFCCAAGAGVGAASFLSSCADATPTVSSSVAATVDNNLAFLIESSCGDLPTCLMRTSQSRVSSTIFVRPQFPRHCVPGSAK